MQFTSVLSLAIAALGASSLLVQTVAAEADIKGSHPDISGTWVAKPHKVHRFFYKTGEVDTLHNSTSTLNLQQDGCHLWGNRTWEDKGVMSGSESLVGSFLSGTEENIRILSIPGSESNAAAYKEANVRWDGECLHFVVLAYSSPDSEHEVEVSYTAVYMREEEEPQARRIP